MNVCTILGQLVYQGPVGTQPLLPNGFYIISFAGRSDGQILFIK